MQKIFVWVGLTALLIAMLVGLKDIKNSYKIFQVNPQPDWNADPYAAWHVYHPPTEKFTVSLPVIPQHASENVVDAKTQQVRHYDMYVGQGVDGTTFLVSLIKFPSSEIVNPDETIAAFIADMVKANPNNVLTLSEPQIFHAHSSTHFEIKNELMNMKGVVFMQGDTLYVLSTLLPKGELPQKDFDHFINSFQINEKKASN